MAETERAWHAMTAADVLEEWESDADRGLSPEAATERRRRVGLNQLPEAPRPSAIKQLLAQPSWQLRNPRKWVNFFGFSRKNVRKWLVFFRCFSNCNDNFSVIFTEMPSLVLGTSD